MISRILTKKSSKLYAILLLFLSLGPNLVRGMENEDENDKNSLTSYLWQNKVVVALGSLGVYTGYKFIQTIRLQAAIADKEEPEDIEARLKWGASASYNPFSNKETILHKVLFFYRYSKHLMPVMQILIDYGADPCKQNKKGDTIFHRAARDADRSDIYENLCSLTKQCCGKKMELIDFARTKNILKIPNNKGKQVEDILAEQLYKIVRADNPVPNDTINLLANVGNLFGALFLGQDGEDTDMHIAYAYNKQKKIERLLECGANPNYCIKNKNFLHWTIDYCHEDPHFVPIMQTFINFGSDPYKLSNKGNTIFHKAAKKGINTSFAVSSLAKTKATPEETRLMTTILMLQKRKDNFFSGIPKALILNCIFYNSLNIPLKGKPPISIVNEKVLGLKNNMQKTVQAILDSKN